jgi:hypothetical protein
MPIFRKMRYELSDNAVCPGDPVVFTNQFTGTAPWTVEFYSNGELMSFTTFNNPQVYTETFTETTIYEPISVTDGNGCTAEVNQPATITVFPLPSYYYELSDTEICSGENVVYTNYFTGTAPWTVEFYSNGELMSFTTSDNPQTYTETLTETTTFEPVSVTDGNGCNSPVDQPATITVNPLPTITTEYSATEVCYGETVDFTNYFTGTPPWTVVYEYNGVQDSFTTSDNPDYYSEIFYETTVNDIISVTDGNGCTTYYDNNITTITVYPLPLIEISGELEFCEGQSTILSATEGAFYYWSTGETTQSIVVMTAELFTVTVTDENGCQGVAEATTSYLPVIVPVCPGDLSVLITDEPMTLSGAAPEGGVYSGNGVSGGVFDPSVAGLGAHLITYTIEDICGPQSCEFAITVTDEPITCEDAVISNFPASAEDVCEGEAYSIDFASVVIENAVQEIWTVIPDEAGGFTGRVFNLNVGYVGDVTINLLAVAEDPCDDAQTSVGFMVNPLPTFTHEISDTEICSGAEVTITDYLTGQPPWTMTILEDGETFSFLIEESPAVRVMTLAETLTYTIVSVTDNNGCTLEVNELVIITVNPLPTFSYELSSTELCLGDELIWTEYFTGTPPWTVEFLYNGEPDSFITYDNPEIFTEVVTESFTFEPLTVTDGNGCTSPVDQASVITVNPLPQLSCPSSMTAIVNNPPVLLNAATPEGGLYAGTGVSFDGTDYWFDPSIGVGIWEISYCYADPVTACGTCCWFDFIVKPIPGDEQVICMPAGWSGISSYYIPDEPQLELIFADLNAQNKVVIMLGKDGIYWPGQNINTMGLWNVYQGYKIKMNQPGCIEIFGEIPDDRTVELAKGAGFMPVLCDAPVPADDILGQFENKLLFAFDIYSQLIYWPTGAIFTLENLEPGVGYLIWLNQPGQATFNCEKSDYSNNVKPQPISYDNAPWDYIKSGSPHFISLNSAAYGTLQPGDFIGVFNTQGACAGFTQISDDTKNLLLVAYGDDNTTEAAEGLYEGENMHFRVYRSAVNIETPVEVSFDISMPNTGNFADLGQSKITNITQGSTSIPENGPTEIVVHPNPTLGLTFVEGLSGESKVMLMDSKGNLLYSGLQNNDFNLNLDQYPKGVYTLRILNNNCNVSRKIIVE